MALNRFSAANEKARPEPRLSVFCLYFNYREIEKITCIFKLFRIKGLYAGGLDSKFG
jgi:hypothetical protein